MSKNYRKLLKKLDHFTLPRLAQENIVEDSVYLILAIDDQSSAIPLHRWARSQENILKEINSTINEPLMLRFNSCINSAKGYNENDLKAETPQLSSISTVDSSTRASSVARMGKANSHNFSSAVSLFSDESE